ncbi:EF-hand domain-containing protein [Paraburkholderia oxyphila]|uniref:EF-hand domain-containing protein n=1 Tax=Paraburkholderia oxyphila TaxID=614212 RepID=UPI000481542B|nr:EF-hand domain-containing protein [Paraburkholderia oxyphila]
MKRICLMLAAALMATSMATSAFAQDARMQQLQSRFEAADTNHDGKLTKAEAQAGMPLVAKNFDQIDATHKGYVTLDDIAQFAKKRGQ